MRRKNFSHLGCVCVRCLGCVCTGCVRCVCVRCVCKGCVRCVSVWCVGCVCEGCVRAVCVVWVCVCVCVCEGCVRAVCVWRVCEGCVRAVCVFEGCVRAVCVCVGCVWEKGVHGGQILGRCINFRFTKTPGAPPTSTLKKKNILYKKLSGQCCTFEGTVSREKHGVLSCEVLLRCAFPSRLVKHAKFRWRLR